MRVSQLAFVQGMDDTRAVLRRWNAAPVAAVVPWVLGAGAISLALLGSVLAIAHVATPDAAGYVLPGVNGPADAAAIGRVLFRNSPVLALLAMACVALGIYLVNRQPRSAGLRGAAPAA